jgi:hypothetical protein
MSSRLPCNLVVRFRHFPPQPSTFWCKNRKNEANIPVLPLVVLQSFPRQSPRISVSVQSTEPGHSPSCFGCGGSRHWRDIRRSILPTVGKGMEIYEREWIEAGLLMENIRCRSVWGSGGDDCWLAPQGYPQGWLIAISLLLICMYLQEQDFAYLSIRKFTCAQDL